MLGKRLINSNSAAAGGSCTTDNNNYPSANLAYYKMSDSTDESGSYDGTATDVNFNVAGKFGNAGGFNGSSSNIDFTAGYFNNTTISISAWINSESSAADQSIFNNFDYDGSTSRGFIWRKNANNTLTAQFYNSGTQSNLNTTATVANNVWTNVVLTISSTEANIYINNGTPVTLTQNNLINFHSTSRAGIGSYRFTGGSFQQFFNGKIDNIRIFSKALSSTEVTTLYNEIYCQPTIVPTEHFNTVLYPGNSGTNPRTDVGFAPDLVWIKERTGTSSHYLTDSVRGTNSQIYSNSDAAQTTYSSNITSFDTNGFTLGSATDTNDSSETYVAWNWKAGGDDVQNNDGTIQGANCLVSANQDAGFSIVKYTGNAGNGSIGHGLNNPVELVLIKKTSASESWIVWYEGAGTTNFLELNGATATQTGAGWGGVPTSSIVHLQNGGAGRSNAAANYIAYCFHSVDGMSRVGSYVGTGATGNSIVTGFRPDFLMVKNATGGNSWVIFDNKRNPSNPKEDVLFPNGADAEYTFSNAGVNFLSNGFSLISNSGETNSSGQTYIFLAIAEENVQPEPVLANSFNTVTYTGNNSTNPITNVGFMPDLIWFKNRQAGNSNVLVDSVRGRSKVIFSDVTTAEGTSDSDKDLVSFDTDGFTLGAVQRANSFNKVDSANNIVAWCWKASNDSTINQDGSITSIVSANPAAGFSIVKYTGNFTASTVGHGLNSAPEMVIVKNRDSGTNWWVWHTGLGDGTKYLKLNGADAVNTASSIWNSTVPTSTVFSVANDGGSNGSANDIIAYCFHSVDGYSKIGSYTGNGTNQTIDVGFTPQFVMIKNTTQTSAYASWAMFDNQRLVSYDDTNPLYANLSAAEGTRGNGTGNGDVLEIIFVTDTGFKLGDASRPNGSDELNSNGENFIYYAIA